MTATPNGDLEKLITEAGVSHKRLAYRLNELFRAEGTDSQYTHTSVANWCRRGMTPKWPAPRHLCTVLAEALGRPVGLTEIGMDNPERSAQSIGLAFPRAQQQALTEASLYWRSVNRRNFLTAAPYAASAFSEPVTRWLVSPHEPMQPSSGVTTVGRAHIAELRAAAEDARTWDSRFGGAAWKSHSLTEFLQARVAPLLQARYSEQSGRELFSVAAEIARLAGWTAFDSGRQQVAQRHYIQALRLAKAGGDTHLGSYVLTTMAMQALMRGFASQAIDMAQGAYERVPEADPRVRGFAKLIEARAHAREGDARSACDCLTVAERLQQRGQTEGSGERTWIDFFTRQRIVTDAVEIFRDLGRPKSTFAWHTLGAMPGEAFARSRSIRLSALATSHAQQGDLDASLRLGHESLRLVSQLQTRRGLDYIKIFTGALRPWHREKAVTSYIDRVRNLESSLPG